MNRTAFFASLLALLPVVATAQTAAAPAQAAAAAAPVEPAQKEKLICRKTVETGSLVRGKKTCMTAAEWAKVGDAAREGAQKIIDDNTGRPTAN